MFGFIELITLLLSLSGFGIQPNPKAPTADQSLQYAMPDADLVIHLDAQTLIPNNYKLLVALPNKPEIKASPELSKMVRQVIGQIEGARGLAKGATGIDLATDINDATMFLQFVPQKDPTFVATVHGKFSTALVDKIGKMTKGTVTKVGGGMMVETGGTQPAIGVTKDGVMIAGTANLVRDRLGDSWKSPSHGPGTNLGYAADVINAHPVYAVVMTLSASARAQAIQGVGGKNFLTDLVTRHKLLAFSVFPDGVGWTWIDNSKSGLDSMEMMSQGALELMKAGQIAPRAMVKIALGAIDSYKGTNKQIDALIAHKSDVLKIVENYSGDGNFQQKISKDPSRLRLDVRATGKSLSEVLPAGLMLPGAAFFLFVGRTSTSVQMVDPATTPAVPPKSSPGLGGRK